MQGETSEDKICLRHDGMKQSEVVELLSVVDAVVHCPDPP